MGIGSCNGIYLSTSLLSVREHIFLQDMWSRNIGHMGSLLGSPYRLWGRLTFFFELRCYKIPVSLNLPKCIFPTIWGETADIKETQTQ